MAETITDDLPTLIIKVAANLTGEAKDVFEAGMRQQSKFLREGFSDQRELRGFVQALDQPLVYDLGKELSGEELRYAMLILLQKAAIGPEAVYEQAQLYFKDQFNIF
ncbi:MAG: hypothetical protein KJ597_06985 [Nanoarchaeota archaeon]|nr:hypothetical protein [Nanoarchaeota archaeon]